MKVFLPENLVDEVSKLNKTVKILDLTHNELVTQYLYTDKLENDSILIDCRTKDEYKTWHYPGALFLDLSHLIAAYKSLDKSKTYVLYCAYGLQTAVAAELMQKEGFNAYSFEGGVKGLMKYQKK